MEAESADASRLKRPTLTVFENRFVRAQLPAQAFDDGRASADSAHDHKLHKVGASNTTQGHTKTLWRQNSMMALKASAVVVRPCVCRGFNMHYKQAVVSRGDLVATAHSCSALCCTVTRRGCVHGPKILLCSLAFFCLRLRPELCFRRLPLL